MGRVVRMPDTRRAYYEAVAEWRRVAASFLPHPPRRHLGDGDARLEWIKAQVKSLAWAPRTHALARVSRLQRWDGNRRRVLPLLAKMPGPSRWEAETIA